MGGLFSFFNQATPIKIFLPSIIVFPKRCLRRKPLSRTPICRKICNKKPWTVPPKLWRNTTSRKTSPLISRRSLIKSTTLPGMQLLEETLDLTLLTKLGTLFIFISDKLPFCCLKAVKNRKRRKKILILKTILILCQVYFFVFKYNE